jgi:hypothetical protein
MESDGPVRQIGLSYGLTEEPEFVNLSWSPGIDSQPGEICFLDSIPELLKRLQIRALRRYFYNLKGAQESIPPDWESFPGLSRSVLIQNNCRQAAMKPQHSPLDLA